jgi:hypothetical protein
MIQGVIQTLLESTAVRTAIGSNKDGDTSKIYAVYADQDEEPPYVVASITGNSPNYCKDGASRMDTVAFQIVTYSRDYAKMDAIDNAIRFTIDGFSGTVSGIALDNVLFENHRDSQVTGKDYMARVSDFKAHVMRTL